MPTEAPWGQQANTYHAREDRRMLDRLPIQAGVVAAGDFKITPVSGMNLQAAAGDAWVAGSHSGVVRQGLYPVGLASTESPITIGAAHASNPRIDQIVLRVRDTAPAPAASGDGENTGKIEVVAGTATAGATLANRTGAAALPASTLRLADILVPAAFTGPFVQNTHIRDRRPWAQGAYEATAITSGNINVTSTSFVLVHATWDRRYELSGSPVEVHVSGFVESPAGSEIVLALFVNGTVYDEQFHRDSAASMYRGGAVLRSVWVPPSPGSYALSIMTRVASGAGVIYSLASRPLTFSVNELAGRQLASNTGA